MEFALAISTTCCSVNRRVSLAPWQNADELMVKNNMMYKNFMCIDYIFNRHSETLNKLSFLLVILRNEGSIGD
jgi:hypothetical protein